MRNVFWTGGWDSTFRVLDLVINQKETVCPFYLIFSKEERPSTSTELQTIQSIRDELARQFPEALERLQPLQTFDAGELEEDQKITDANYAIREERVFGTQYHWIARFVQEQQMGRFEMSIDRDDKPRKLLLEYMDRDGDTLHVSEQFAGTKEHTLFQWFDFPLAVWDRQKAAMGEHARDSGFLDLLEKAWFCHLPWRGEACGRCAPCRYTIADGMGYRLSWRARYIRYPQAATEYWLKQNLPSAMVIWLKGLKQKTGI